MSEHEYIERVVIVARELISADGDVLAAILAKNENWKSDPAGRRKRSAVLTGANKRRANRMDDLIALVQSPDAPAGVVRHFSTVGPTYYEAARALSFTPRERLYS